MPSLSVFMRMAHYRATVALDKTEERKFLPSRVLWIELAISPDLGKLTLLLTEWISPHSILQNYENLMDLHSS